MVDPTAATGGSRAMAGPLVGQGGHRAAGAMNGPRWQAAELTYLHQLAGEHPFPALLKRMKMRALIEGWPVRSRKAIANRLAHSNERCRARVGGCTTTYGAAEILGVTGDRVAAWLRDPAILAILAPRIYTGIRYIDRRGWRRLARERPEVFGGIPADRLFLLLEDREMADGIAAAHPCGRADWRVRCVETGQVWRSCKEAGAALNVHPSTITKALREGRAVPAVGLRFERLQQQGKG